MRSSFIFKSAAKERFGFVLFGTFIWSIIWLSHSGASSWDSDSNNLIRRGKQARRLQSATAPQSCSTCAAQGSQTIYAPLIELPESSNTEINLNCRSPHVMDVTPTFYTTQGERFVGNAFQMQPPRP